MSFVNHDYVHQLFKYVSAGLLLPVTEEQYRARVFLPAHVSEKVSEIVRHLTEAHALIKPHCGAYKDDLHPTIVQLAGEVHDLLQKMTDGLDQAPDDIKGQAEEHVYQISILFDRAQKTMHSLESFREHIGAHRVTIQARCDDAREMRDAQNSVLRDVEGELQGSRNELAINIALHEEYKTKAILAASSAVIFPIAGPLAGGITAGVYLKKAADTAQRIAEIKDRIERLVATISSTNTIIACLHVIEADLENIMTFSRGAAETIHRTIAFWQRLAVELTQIKEALNKIAEESSPANLFVAILRANLKGVGVIVAEYKEVVHDIDDAHHDAVDAVLAQLSNE
ncbi:uncharacterized protein SCHCODRAFT_01215107 [Schizophyllum commune H4-8]|nr:uncharacterized protein SCHCODRAFT_01215107 [Schizophyllum commune H4-8]KAI5889403.1 hypothetical protein SCHCODRAFT_01215107 [Schizophyllum commune H4-8]